MNNTATTEYVLDATDQRLGRIASEIAVLLMGKELPSFSRNTLADVTVTVNNASLMNIDAKKMKEKVYDRYSGYPGGRKEQTMEKVVSDKGYAAILTNAVNGMLPKNKLQPLMIKNLIINE